MINDASLVREDGEAWRHLFGIDGTAGDAMDVDHPFVPASSSDGSPCIVCGLAHAYRRHTSDWAQDAGNQMITGGQ